MTPWRGKQEPETYREIVALRNRSRRRLRRAVGLVVLLGLLVAVPAAWISQIMVSPARSRLDDTARPVLGLVLRELPGPGVLVANAAGPARSAGLRPGDRILALDGAPVETVGQVRSLIGSAEPGLAIRIEARRPEPGGTLGGVLVEVSPEIRTVSPADLGLDYQEVAITDPWGLTLRGWYVPPPRRTRAPAVAYGHGHASDRRQWLDFAWEVHEAGFGQLFLDFAGRGESEGEVITFGPREAAALRSGLEFLSARPELDSSRLYLAGHGMGAAAAILAAAEGAPVRGLVLDSPYTDLARVVDENLAARFIPPWPLRPLAFRIAGWRAHYDPNDVRPIDDLRRSPVPLLILHGTEDRRVAIAHSRELAKAAAGRCRLVPLEGLGHDHPRTDEARDAVVDFLRSSLR